MHRQPPKPPSFRILKQHRSTRNPTAHPKSRAVSTHPAPKADIRVRQYRTGNARSAQIRSRRCRLQIGARDREAHEPLRRGVAVETASSASRGGGSEDQAEGVFVPVLQHHGGPRGLPLLGFTIRDQGPIIFPEVSVLLGLILIALGLRQSISAGRSGLDRNRIDRMTAEIEKALIAAAAAPPPLTTAATTTTASAAASGAASRRAVRPGEVPQRPPWPPAYSFRHDEIELRAECRRTCHGCDPGHCRAAQRRTRRCPCGGPCCRCCDGSRARLRRCRSGSRGGGFRCDLRRPRECRHRKHWWGSVGPGGERLLVGGEAVGWRAVQIEECGSIGRRKSIGDNLLQPQIATQAKTGLAVELELFVGGPVDVFLLTVG